MEKIITNIDKSSTKEFIQGTFLFSWVAFAFSFVLIGLYITFGIINNSWSEFLQIVLVVLGGLLLILSILIIFNYLNALKKVEDFKRTIVYDFLDEYIAFDIYREQEVIENGKVYYVDLIDYKVTKNYVFLRLKNNTWLAIKKEEGLIDFITSKGIVKHNALRIVRK